MGWGHGTNAEGRDVGYNVIARCDEPGCGRVIDRGLAHVCGGMHDGGEHGCGRYLCADHLFFMPPAPDGTRVDGYLCTPCADEWEKRDD